MALRYKVINIIHFDSPTLPGKESLCGQKFTGKVRGIDFTGEETRSKVICPNCIKIVNYCKKISPAEIGSTKSK